MTEQRSSGSCQWRYALVNGVRTDIEKAQSGDLGECELCHGQLRARKGDVRVPHWAHVSHDVCDSWHESKGPWHIAWQNEFPEEWRECLIVKDQDRHIADIRTKHGLVIEFQHSAMNRDEQEAREKFYGNMIWVVDGKRLKNDWARFEKNANANLKNILNHATRSPTMFCVASDSAKIFPHAWLNSTVPVLFDFGKDVLWSLLPTRTKQGASMAIPFLRNVFIQRVTNHISLFDDSPVALVAELSRILDFRRTYVPNLLPRPHRHYRL